MTEAQLLEALLAEIHAKDAGPADARTTLEWGPYFGVRNEKSIRERIRMLLASGDMERVKVNRFKMNGQPQIMDAYRLTGRRDT